MADRTEQTGERPFGRDSNELPHRDVRTSVPSDVQREAAPAAKDAPVVHETEVTAGEVLEPGGQRHEAALDPANTTPRDVHVHDERAEGHTADHAAAPPSGSAHSAIETPKDGKSRKMLIGAVAAVIAILAIMMLLPAGADASGSPLLTLVGT